MAQRTVTPKQTPRDFERLTAAWKANEITVQTGV